MHDLTIDFHRRLQAGENPVPYLLVTSGMGYHIYTAIDGRGRDAITAAYRDDGEIVVTGQARIAAWGAIRRSIRPQRSDLLIMYQRYQQGSARVYFDDPDDRLPATISRETLLGQQAEVRIGFPDLAISSHITLFTGEITRIAVTGGRIAADLTENPSQLTDTYYAQRAEGCPAPYNDNDRLPRVYGDLTQGDVGAWKLPLIDTENRIYCYSMDPVVDPAGQTIFVAGVAQEEGVDYTFDPDNATLKHYATVTFLADLEESAVNEVTAIGKGKTDESGALIENPVDVVEDFLSEAGWTGEFNDHKTSRARSICARRRYRAAGVINRDASIISIVLEIMGSFLGSAYLDGRGRLCLDIDEGPVGMQYGNILPRHETRLEQAEQSLENLINQALFYYRYNYDLNDWDASSSGTTTQGTSSKGIYGVRSPEDAIECKWCRESTIVDQLIEIIISKLCQPVWGIELDDVTLKRVMMDVGDDLAVYLPQIRAADFNATAFVNQICKITDLAIDLNRGTVRFGLLDFGAYMTEGFHLADGSVTAGGSIVAGGDRDTEVYS